MSLQLLQDKLIEKYPEISKKEAKEMAKTVFESAKEIVDEHERFNMPEFGVFTKKKRKGRTVKVPKSDLEVEVPDKQTIGFKEAKSWKEELNPNLKDN